MARLRLGFISPPTGAPYLRGNVDMAVGGMVLTCVLMLLCCSCSKYDARQHYNAGVNKAASGDNAGAIAEYDEAIRIRPDYAKAYLNRGNAKTALVTDCTRAIELNPRYSEAYNNRGNAKRGLKDFDGAIADYNKAIELNPQYAKAYTNRAGVELLKREAK